MIVIGINTDVMLCYVWSIEYLNAARPMMQIQFLQQKFLKNISSILNFTWFTYFRTKQNNVVHVNVKVTNPKFYFNKFPIIF